jgi:hypothetical protein
MSSITFDAALDMLVSMFPSYERETLVMLLAANDLFFIGNPSARRLARQCDLLCHSHVTFMLLLLVRLCR